MAAKSADEPRAGRSAYSGYVAPEPGKTHAGGSGSSPATAERIAASIEETQPTQAEAIRKAITEPLPSREAVIVQPVRSGLAQPSGYRVGGREVTRAAYLEARQAAQLRADVVVTPPLKSKVQDVPGYYETLYKKKPTPKEIAEYEKLMKGTTVVSGYDPKQREKILRGLRGEKLIPKIKEATPYDIISTPQLAAYYDPSTGTIVRKTPKSIWETVTSERYGELMSFGEKVSALGVAGVLAVPGVQELVLRHEKGHFWREGVLEPGEKQVKEPYVKRELGAWYAALKGEPSIEEFGIKKDKWAEYERKIIPERSRAWFEWTEKKLGFREKLGLSPKEGEGWVKATAKAIPGTLLELPRKVAEIPPLVYGAGATIGMVVKEPEARKEFAESAWFATKYTVSPEGWKETGKTLISPEFVGGTIAMIAAYELGRAAFKSSPFYKQIPAGKQPYVTAEQQLKAQADIFYHAAGTGKKIKVISPKPALAGGAGSGRVYYWTGEKGLPRGLQAATKELLKRGWTKPRLEAGIAKYGETFMYFQAGKVSPQYGQKQVIGLIGKITKPSKAVQQKILAGRGGITLRKTIVAEVKPQTQKIFPGVRTLSLPKGALGEFEHIVSPSSKLYYPKWLPQWTTFTYKEYGIQPSLKDIFKIRSPLARYREASLTPGKLTIGQELSLIAKETAEKLPIIGKKGALLFRPIAAPGYREWVTIPIVSRYAAAPVVDIRRPVPAPEIPVRLVSIPRPRRETVPLLRTMPLPLPRVVPITRRGGGTFIPQRTTIPKVPERVAPIEILERPVAIPRETKIRVPERPLIEIITTPPPPTRITRIEPSVTLKRIIAKIRRQPGFQLQVRRFGAFQAVGGVLPKGKALKKGQFIVGQTLAATFRLEPKGTVTGLDIPVKIGKEYRPYKIVKGQKIGTPLQFIEKRKYRLKTRSEVQEIMGFKKTKTKKKGGVKFL